MQHVSNLLAERTMSPLNFLLCLITFKKLRFPFQNVTLFIILLYLCLVRTMNSTVKNPWFIVLNNSIQNCRGFPFQNSKSWLPSYCTVAIFTKFPLLSVICWFKIPYQSSILHTKGNTVQQLKFTLPSRFKSTSSFSLLS